MANWSDLKSAVASIIKTNGNQQITGQLLQDVLNNIISNVGKNASFAGVATPTSTPGTPDENVFYLALTQGTYSNFGGASLKLEEVAVLTWKGSWVKTTIIPGTIWMEAINLELPFTKSFTKAETLFNIQLNRVDGKLRLLGTCSSEWTIFYQISFEDKTYKNHYYKNIGSGSFDIVLDLNSITNGLDFSSNESRITRITITANSGNTTGSIAVNKVLATNNVVDSISIAELKNEVDSYIKRKETELPLSFYREDLPIQVKTLDVVQELFNISLNNASEKIRLIGSSTALWSFYIQVRNKSTHISKVYQYVNPGEYDIEMDIAEALKLFSNEQLKDIIQINIAANSGTSYSVETFILKEVYGNIDAISSAGVAYLSRANKSFTNEYGKKKVYSQFLRYNTLLDGRGNIIDLKNYQTSAWFEIPRDEYDVMIADGGIQNIDLLGSFSGFCIYDENKNFIEAFQVGKLIRIDDYPTAKYFMMGASNNGVAAGANVTFYSDTYAAKKIKDNEKAISNMFKLEEAVSLGYKHGSGYQDWFSPSTNPRTTVLTQKDSASPFDGIVETVSVDSLSIGKLCIAIGTLDQNNICIPSKEFDVDVVGGLQTINVLSKGLKIKQGEQLFVYVNKYSDLENKGGGGAQRYINADMYPNTYKDTENEFIYGRLESPLVRLKTTYGGRSSFAYTVIPECAFAVRTEVESLRAQVENQSSIIAKSQYVYDENGNAYTLRVINGEIVPKTINIKNVLCLGNSLTSHGLLTSIGYYGNGWAMAATSKQMDWCSHLERMLKQKQSDAVVTRHNIAAWERNLANYLTDDSIATLMEGYMTSDVDLVIFKAGENVVDTAYMQQALTKMVSWLKKTYPDCTIVLCTQFWANAKKDSIITSVANSNDCKFLNSVGGNYLELLGDYTYGEDGNQHPIINQGVAAHVSDYGFYIWANALGAFLGLNQLYEAFNINVNTSFSYKLNWSKGVKNGLITILLKSAPNSVIIKDESGTTINYTLHDMTNVSFQSTPSYVPTHAITFVMPSSDVNVSIS